jgi:hypothetical protein
MVQEIQYWFFAVMISLSIISSVAVYILDKQIAKIKKDRDDKWYFLLERRPETAG